LAAFTEALRRLGWVEGQNLRIESRWAAGDANRARTVAKELIELQPDVIVAATSFSLAALVHETNSLPIVFVGVSFPIEQGYVTNLAKPGSNITGFSNQPEFSLSAKWAELLKEIAPNISRIAVMFHVETTRDWVEPLMAVIQGAVTSLGIEMIRMPIDNTDQIEASVAEFARTPSGGIIVLPDNFLGIFHRDLVIRVIANHRVPAVYGFAVWAREGGLIAYGNEPIEPYRRAASYADRILRGEKPGDLPVQQPTKFEFVINLKTAKALGLTVPPGILVGADEVIE
jgi:putative ABC transport system substrate-binding protein